MNLGGLAYESTLPAHAEGLPAYDNALPGVEDTPVAPAALASVDRGTDWPLLCVFFGSIAAAYAAIAYGLYVLAHAVF